MLTLAFIIHLFMCWISNWNILWPLKMLIDGAIGDKAIAIGWIILLIVAL